VCVPLGLKKPGDVTVSEGHGYPLVLYNESKHNILIALVVGKVNKVPLRDRRGAYFGKVLILGPYLTRPLLLGMWAPWGFPG
jgi:hypothetical protein